MSVDSECIKRNVIITIYVTMSWIIFKRHWNGFPSCYGAIEIVVIIIIIIIIVAVHQKWKLLLSNLNILHIECNCSVQLVSPLNLNTVHFEYKFSVQLLSLLNLNIILIEYTFSVQLYSLLNKIDKWREHITWAMLRSLCNSWKVVM